MAVVLKCVLMGLRHPLAVWALCLSFQIDRRSRSFTISPTTNTTGRHLGFERDYNYHTAFRARDVIMHKVHLPVIHSYSRLEGEISSGSEISV